MTNRKYGLSVLIVNYNSGSYALDCIRSLFDQVDVRLEIIVVDNASRDESLHLLKQAFGDQIKLIPSLENIGFGKANNLAAQYATQDYMLILNPDTVIPDKKVLLTMIRYLDAHAELGMVGPAIDEPRKNKKVMPRMRYPSSHHLRSSAHLNNLPGDIAWLLGACLLIRRFLYEEIKGFDPDYFLYGEDVDICLRLRQHGYALGYCEAARITHIAGVSEVGADTLDKWLRKKRGLYLFVRKHFSLPDAIWLAKATIRKAWFQLQVIKVKAIFVRNNSLQDEANKIQATRIAAKELLEIIDKK